MTRLEQIAISGMRIMKMVEDDRPRNRAGKAARYAGNI